MIIEGLDIFITWKQYEQLMTEDVSRKINNIKLLEKNNMLSSLRKFNAQRNKILLSEIKRQMITVDGSDKFLNSWLKFDVIGEEAKENTWNLITDFCTRNSCFQILTNQNYTSSGKFYPYGKYFSLVHKSPKIKTWYGKSVQDSTETEILIETDKVRRLNGEFNSLFTITFEDKELVFGRGLSVLPVKDNA